MKPSTTGRIRLFASAFFALSVSALAQDPKLDSGLPIPPEEACYDVLSYGDLLPALRERTDSCTVPAAGVVGEAMLALVLAGAHREKFGGDHIDDVRAALAAYEERIGWKRRRP